MNNPLVSIIVPCYNQAQYLEEALQSVYEQSYTYWECFIVNDGSPDHTEEVAKKWVQKDSRFIYLKKENGGLSSARNLGLNAARGDYIQFLDSDDILDFEKLEKSLLELKEMQFKKMSMVVSHFRFFTKNIEDATDLHCNLSYELLNYRSVLYDWDYTFSIPIHCGLFSASLFHDFRFSIDLKAKEDWFMWLHFFGKNVEIYFINLPLAFYRSHAESMTKDLRLMQENTIKVLKLIKNIIPVDDYNDYLIFVIQQKTIENEKNRCELAKFKNLREYKILEKLKKNFLVLFFFKCYVFFFRIKKNE